MFLHIPICVQLESDSEQILNFGLSQFSNSFQIHRTRLKQFYYSRLKTCMCSILCQVVVGILFSVFVESTIVLKSHLKSLDSATYTHKQGRQVQQIIQILDSGYQAKLTLTRYYINNQFQTNLIIIQCISTKFR